MSLFEVSIHIVGVVLHDRVLHVHVVVSVSLGISGFECIVLEVEAPFVISLK
jgi:hypothetical protein